MTDETVGGTGITSWQWPLPAYHPWLVQSRLARARARQPAIRSWSTAQNRSCQIFDSHQLEPVLSRLQKFSPNKAPVYIRKDLPQKKAMSNFRSQFLVQTRPRFQGRQSPYRHWLGEVLRTRSVVAKLVRSQMSSNHG